MPPPVFTDNPTMEQLKLAALDKDDLDVLSAHLQDAILTVGDLKYLPGEQRFLATVNRFAWEKKKKGGKIFGIGALPGRARERRRTALHFERVINAQSSNIRQDAKDGILSLLSLGFTPAGEPEDDPSGIVELVFSGGGTIRLEVECIEAQLTDLGASWATKSAPEHDLSDADGSEAGGPEQ